MEGRRRNSRIADFEAYVAQFTVDGPQRDPRKKAITVRMRAIRGQRCRCCRKGQL